MAVVGLDLSLTGAGVAVVDDDGLVHSNTFGYSVKNPTSHDQVLRNIKITKGIINFIRDFKIDYVAVENYGFAGHGLTKQAELGGLVKAQIYLNFKKVVVPIPSKTIRAFLMPKSKKKSEKGSKERQKVVSVKTFVENHLRSLGYESPKNDNEFDALAVALVMQSYRERNSQKWNKQQLAVFSRIDEQMVKD